MLDANTPPNLPLSTIATADGAHTLLRTDINETYHSTHGALQEARHVFIQQGLKPMADEGARLSIFEMGFGTGLNAALALEFAVTHQLQLEYVSMELHPLPETVIQALNYAQLLPNASAYMQLHQAEWGKPVAINQHFELCKLASDFHKAHIAEAYFDLVFYDAFGPRVAPEMWEMPAVEKLYNAMKIGGRLVTYCAQGAFKRNLKAVGFEVQSLPGPPGKREMTLAIKH